MGISIHRVALIDFQKFADCMALRWRSLVPLHILGGAALQLPRIALGGPAPRTFYTFGGGASETQCTLRVEIIIQDLRKASS